VHHFASLVLRCARDTGCVLATIVPSKILFPSCPIFTAYSGASGTSEAGILG